MEKDNQSPAIRSAGKRVLRKPALVPFFVVFLSLMLSIVVYSMHPERAIGNVLRRAAASAVEDIGVSISAESQPQASFGRITLKNVRIGVAGCDEPVARISEVIVRQSVFGVLRYFVFGMGRTDVVMSGADIDISERTVPPRQKSSAESSGCSADAPSSDAGDNPGARVLKVLSRFGDKFSVAGVNVDFAYGDADGNRAAAEGAGFSVAVGKGGIRHFAVNVPKVAVEIADGGSGVLRDMRTTEDKRFTIGSVSFDSERFSFASSNISGEASGYGLSLSVPDCPAMAGGREVDISNGFAGVEFSRAGIKAFAGFGSTGIAVGGKNWLQFGDCEATYDSANTENPVSLSSSVTFGSGGNELASGEFDFTFDGNGEIGASVTNLRVKYVDRGLVASLKSFGRMKHLKLDVKSDGDDSISGDVSYGIADKSCAFSVFGETSAFGSGTSFDKVVASGLVENGSSVRIEGTGSLEGELSANASVKADMRVFGRDVSLDASVNVRDDDVRVSDAVLECGDYRLRPTADFNMKDGFVSFDFVAFRKGIRAGSGHVGRTDGIYHTYFKSESGAISLDLSADVTSQFRSAEATVGLYGTEYDFSSVFKDDYLYVNGSGVTMELNVGDKVEISAEFRDFIIPDVSESDSDNFRLNTAFDLSWSRSTGEVELSPSDARISGSGADCTFSMFFYGDTFRIDDFRFTGVRSDWSGALALTLPDLKGDFYRRCRLSAFASDASHGREFLMSVIPKDGASDVMVRARSGDIIGKLSGFGVASFDLNAILSTDFTDIRRFYASIDVEGSKKPIFVADIVYDGHVLYTDGASLSIFGLDSEKLDLSVDFGKSSLNFSTIMHYPYARTDKISDFRFSSEGKLDFPKGIALVKLPETLRRHSDFGVRIFDFALDDMEFPDMWISGVCRNGTLTLDSDDFKGFFNVGEMAFDVDVSDRLPISGRFRGAIGDLDLEITADIRHLPLRLGGIIIYRPIVKVSDGDLHGSLLFCGRKDNPEVYCTLTADSMKIWNFWTEAEQYTVNNITLVGTGHSVRLLRTSGSAFNKGRKTLSRFEVEASLIFENMDIPYWRVNTYVPPGNPVQVNVPLLPVNYNIDARYATGDMELSGEGMGNIKVKGKFYADDAMFSRPSRYQRWVFGSRSGSGSNSISIPDADVDITITVGSNTGFVYPERENPLVHGRFKEGQTVRIVYFDESGDFYIDGTAQIEGGEVFYFRKKFNIMSGDVSWPLPDEKDVLGIKPTGPNINLKASLRDFDSEGNGVDYYINVNNASLDDFHPSFSASVSMTESEIMMHLGRTVLESDKNYTDVQFFANVSTMALDLMSVMRYTSGGGSLSFTEGLGIDLGLDVFVLNTRLIYNFIADASSSFFNQFSRTSGSAFSRYLDGTILSIGKRFGRDFMFSAQFELMNAADRMGRARGIELSADLRCLFTFGVEWNTPIARVSFFTKPLDFSIPGFFTGIGVSLNRSFAF